MPHTRGVSPSPFVVPDAFSSSHRLLHGHGVSLYLDLQPPNSWPWHRHETAQIVVALDPVRAQMQWGSEAAPVTVESDVPHIWFVPPNVAHHAVWNDAGAMLVMYPTRAFISTECGRDLSQAILLPLRPCMSQHYLVGEYCDEFYSICHGKRESTDIVNVARATLLALHLLRHYFARQRLRVETKTLLDPRVNRILTFIEAHLREPITRELLAREANVSVPHLGKIFKAVTGDAVMAYVWRRRLHTVRKYLETGEWKVSAVAAEFRFSDQSHLVRKFRRAFRCTPSSVVPRPNRDRDR